jgi:hypothetical protein
LKHSGTEYGWLTIHELAEAFGYSNQNFHKLIIPKLPPEAIQKNGQTSALYLGKAVREFLIKRSDHSGNGQTTKTLDPLEQVKLQLAQIKLEKERLSFVSVERVQQRFTQVAQMLRSCGEQLQAKYDKDAYKLLDQTLIEAERIVSEPYASDESSEPLGE